MSNASTQSEEGHVASTCGANVLVLVSTPLLREYRKQSLVLVLKHQALHRLLSEHIWQHASAPETVWLRMVVPFNLPME